MNSYINIKQIFYQSQKLFFAVFLLINLNYCSTEIGNPESEEEINNITGIASKGPIHNGIIHVYQLKPDASRGDLLGTSTTNLTGLYSVNLNYSGPVEVMVSSGSYKDDATGESVSIPSDFEMRTLLPSILMDTQVSITPLTTFAASYTRQIVSEGLITAIDKANTRVAEAFGLFGIDISAQRPSDLTIAGSDQENALSKKYGAVLAGLSQTAKDNGKSPLEVLNLINDMAEDFQDGNFDWKNGAGEVYTITGLIDPVQAYVELDLAVQNFLDSPQNQSGFSVSDFFQTINTNEPTGIIK